MKLKANTWVERLEKLWWAFYLLAVLVIAFFYAYRRIFDVEFIPTNGDFQNYNVFRRIMDGQIPYKDFANYLGMGVILINTPFFFIQNSFVANLFITNFTTKILFMLFLFVVVFLVTNKKGISCAVSLLLVRIIEQEWLSLIPGYGYYYNYNFLLMARPNNSMRMTRAFLPILFVIIICLLLRLCRRRKGHSFDVFEHVDSKRFCALLGFGLGLGVVWSNDFGFACVGSAFLILLVLLIYKCIKRLRKIVLPLLVFVGTCGAGALVSALILTRGHLRAFFEFTLGVGSYQYWYFGIYSQDKIHSVAEFLTQPDIVIQTVFFLVAVGWAIYRLVKKTLSTRNILFMFAYASTYFAMIIYMVGAGGNHFMEATVCFSFLTGMSILYNLLTAAIRRAGAAREAKGKRSWKKAMRVFSGAMACFLFLYTAYIGYGAAAAVREYQIVDFPSRDNYVAGLGGVTDKADELHEIERFVNGQPVFSTYATALEVMQGQFQPTGTDYIIHALGDEQRQHYVDTFIEGNFPYVQTLDVYTYTWEPWLFLVNWDFYSVLYRDYRISLRTHTWNIWEPVPQGETNLLQGNVKIEIEKVSETETVINVTTDIEETCIVDVALSYDSDFVFNLYRMQTWKRSVWISSESSIFIAERSSCFLPTEAEGHHFPVTVVNGKGSIRMSSLPVECTTLQVESVVAGDIYRLP